jgi:peptidoglycan/LPS O-acetylase OafA/YrhL
LETRSKNIGYISSLDQLRAVAMLMVFFAHSIHNFTRGLNRELGDWLYPDNPIWAVMAEGHAGVALLIVMSGFLFAYGSYGKEINISKFLINRALRIYPMYIFVLFLGAYTYKEQFSLLGLISSLTLFSNTPAALNGGMFTILLWTISIELTFYLIFPHLHRCYNHYGSSFLFKVIVLFILLRVVAVGLGASPRDLSYFTIFGRMDQFLLGMLAAYQLRQGRLKYFSGLLPCCLFIAYAVLALYAFNQYGGGWVSDAAWKILWPTLEGLIFSGLLIAVTSTQKSLLPKIVASGLEFIGMISFSIYLLHQPVMSVAQNWGFKIGLSDSIYLDAFLTGLVLLAPVCGLSWLTYSIVEKPFLELRKRYLAAKA